MATQCPNRCVIVACRGCLESEVESNRNSDLDYFEENEEKEIPKHFVIH